MTERAAPSPSRLPTEDDLPCDDGVPMETYEHREQLSLLIDPLFFRYWADRDDVYVGGNQFFYFSLAQVKTNDVRGPDVFVVLDVQSRRWRKSWVTWEEGCLPHLIVELTSESTRRVDRVTKKDVYERIGIPWYVIYDPFTVELLVWRHDGERFVPVDTSSERVHIPEMALDLAVWRGAHKHWHFTWLRWHLPDGPPLPTEEEVARASAEVAQEEKVERQRAEAERQRAEAERERAEAERTRAEARAEALAAELAALKARLE